MVIAEAVLGHHRGVVATEGPSRPLSERQLAAFKIIRSSLPSQIDQGDIPLSNIPFDVLSSMPRFPQIYSTIENMALFGHGGSESIERLTTGIVFHQLAHASIANASDNSGIILPEPVAFEVTRALNPDAEVIDHPFSPGIKGSYVADALEVSVMGRTVSVTGFVEYSTVEMIDKFVDQIRASRKLAVQLGFLADNPEFIVVVPEGSNIKVPRVIAETVVRKIEAPFSYADIRACIKYMTEVYRRNNDPDVASISDLAQARLDRAEKIRKIGEPALYRLRQEAVRVIELEADVPEDIAA
ncbi:MAG: hypothetical protein AAB895_02870 [Patescibacteria group bacterium]